MMYKHLRQGAMVRGQWTCTEKRHIYKLNILKFKFILQTLNIRHWIFLVSSSQRHNLDNLKSITIIGEDISYKQSIII